MKTIGRTNVLFALYHQEKGLSLINRITYTSGSLKLTPLGN